VAPWIPYPIYMLWTSAKPLAFPDTEPTPFSFPVCNLVTILTELPRPLFTALHGSYSVRHAGCTVHAALQ
jgi:hypothetical protein